MEGLRDGSSELPSDVALAEACTNSLGTFPKSELSRGIRVFAIHPGRNSAEPSMEFLLSWSLWRRAGRA